MIVKAYGLTRREREATALALRGRPKATWLRPSHVSRYVHDHLKSIYEKTGAPSRREFIARVFQEQVQPLAEACAVGSDGWSFD
ncbi:MAG: hypothetical protein M3019_02340 [Candidatus Dormibacteraeota bacterium]|nr:hypothetical protein [Candidatus Dormibacteraeota bacterium]